MNCVEYYVTKLPNICILKPLDRFYVCKTTAVMFVPKTNLGKLNFSFVQQSYTINYIDNIC